MAFGIQGNVLERLQQSISLVQGLWRVLVISDLTSLGLCASHAACTTADMSHEPKHTALSEEGHEIGVKRTPKGWWVGEERGRQNHCSGVRRDLIILSSLVVHVFLSINLAKALCFNKSSQEVYWKMTYWLQGPKRIRESAPDFGVSREANHIGTSEFTTAFQKQLRFLEAEVSKKKVLE